MNFMINSSSPTFRHHPTTAAHPPKNHHLEDGGAPPSSAYDNNEEEEEDIGALHLFITRSEKANDSTTNTSLSTAATATPIISLIEKEHMFDKAVTPSDVGKLNRLVIPKQHAERYFPLNSSTNEKGLLLSFEDGHGKPWRFRYSYWNSSQSYVMTKGWSRFVKEKKLDAGDIVSFKRGLGELGKDRLFIDWRRRPDGPPSSLHHRQLSFHRSLMNPWTFASSSYPMFLQSHQHHRYTGNNDFSTNVVNGNPCPPEIYGSQRSLEVFQLQRKGVIGNHQQQEMVLDSVPVVQGRASAKRLRLFGVNLDCPIQESDECYNNNNVLPSKAMPMCHNFVEFDSSSSPSSSSAAYLQLRPYNDDDDDDCDEGNKGSTSMSPLDLDII